MKTKQVVRKSRIGWVLADTYVVAYDKLQATIYSRFGTNNDVAVQTMKQRVLDSKEDELNSWVDVIELAQEVGIVGHGTEFKPKWD